MDIICFRCSGRKELYRIMGGYSLEDSGGIKVICPMCNGIGKIKSLETVLQENEKKVSRYKKNPTKEQ